MTGHPEIILGYPSAFETCPDWVPGLDAGRWFPSISHAAFEWAGKAAEQRDPIILSVQPSPVFAPLRPALHGTAAPVESGMNTRLYLRIARETLRRRARSAITLILREPSRLGGMVRRSGAAGPTRQRRGGSSPMICERALVVSLARP